MVHEARLWRGVAHRAIRAGYGVAVSLTKSRLTTAGNCENPTVLQRWGRPSPADPGGKHIVVPRDGIPYGVDIIVRCRKCRNCMRYRSNLWASRVTLESMKASRCWFVTLTFSVDSHMHLATVDPRSLKNGTPMYAVRAAQKYVKRLRKAMGVYSLRHMWVCELHESGLPHIHMLLFEQTLSTLPKRLLQRAWGYGFAAAKLVDEPANCAKYVVKYMSKADDLSIRASLHFGTPLGANGNKDTQITPLDRNPMTTPPYTQRRVF